MKNRKEFVTQITILAVVISMILPITALFIDLIVQKDVTYSVKGFLKLYSENPLHWVILSLLIVLPTLVFFVARIFSGRLAEKQKIIDYEQNRTKIIADFTQGLIKEDFSKELEISDDDILGKSLLNLRDTLNTNKENEIKRRNEDDQRNWSAEGLAKLNEILRNDINDIEALSFNVIKELTEYIDASQGGFYTLKNGEGGNKYFDLTSFFAYDRKKFANQRIEWGDGLIGTSALEKRSIYLTDVPEDYVNVTSGLGYTNPSTVFIVPLIREEEIFGVIEVASLNKLEPYQIDFVEKIAGSIASTLSLASINIRTSKLLEETKAQTQTLSSQEEEMRQNMEELQATQEEATRQAKQFVLLENTINHTLVRAEYNSEGYLLYANTKFLNKLEYTKTEEVEGQHITAFIDKKDRQWFTEIWNNLSKGGRHFEGYMKHLTRTGKDLWTMATYTCIRHEDDKVNKVLFLALDATEQKNLSLKMEGIINSVDRSGIKLELDISGNIIDHNETFLTLFGYSQNEISSLTVFDLIDNLELDNFSNKWDTIIKGIGYQGKLKVKIKDGENKWIRGAFSAVYDMYGDVDRIFYIGQDVTNEIKIEIEMREQTEILKKQEKLLRESRKELSKQLRDVKLEIKNECRHIELLNKRYEIIFNNAVDAVITTSSDNRIIYFNNTAEKLWGYNKDEVLNRDIGILFSNKVIDEDKFVAAYVGTGDAKIINTRKKVTIAAKDGKEKPVLLLLSKAKVENEITYTAFVQNIGS